MAAGRGWPTHVPALLGPAPAAFLVLAATPGRRGVTDLLRRTVRWRVGWRWWLVAVSMLIVAQALVQVGLDLRARRTGRLSPPAPAPHLS